MNKKVYFEYHRIHGHSSDKFQALKIKIEELIQKCSFTEIREEKDRPKVLDIPQP